MAQNQLPSPLDRKGSVCTVSPFSSDASCMGILQGKSGIGRVVCKQITTE
jgi:hypothetical protein